MKITITEPNGENLDVWNKIKDNGDIGYFLQEGDLIRGRYYTAEERAKFQQEVQQIISEHPNSFYAQSLRQSLDKFRASEAERQEYMKKLYKQKPQ